MKTNWIRHFPARWLGIVSVILLACGLSARADDLSWWGTGATPNWSDSGNWTNLALVSAVPANGDSLVFTAPGSWLDNTNDLSGLSVGWLRFDNGNLALYGNPLTVGSGVTNTMGDNSFGLALTLSAAQTFQVDGGSLTFNSSLTNTGDLVIAGTGNVTWNSTATTGIKGAGNVILNGPGTLTLPGGFLNPGVNFGFTGSTIVNGGQLVVQIGNWAGYSVFGNSLTINPGGSVQLNQPHPAGSTGVPLYVYGGTIDWNLNNGAYFTTVVLSNAYVTSTTGSGDLRGSGTFTNLASSGPTTFGAVLNLSSSRTITVEEGSADPDIDFSAGATVAINGSGALTKVGLGKMRISGPDTHTGTTTISEGTLVLTSTMANTPTIAVATNAIFDISGAFMSLSTNQTLAGVGTVLGTLNDNDAGAVGSALSPGGNGVVGTLTVDGLNLSGSSLALNFDLGSATTVGGAVNDLLIVTNLTLSGGNTNMVNFNPVSGSLAQGVPYTLIRYTSCGAPDGPVTTLAAPPSHFIYSFNNDTANSRITVTIVGNPFNLVWKGDGVTNAWDITTTINWLNNGITPITYFDGDNATFNDTGYNTPAINVTTTVKPTTVTVNATKDYVFSGSGKISGGAKLLKSNSGNLTLLTPNDFSAGGSLSGSGLVNVGNGGGTGGLGTGNLTNNTKVTFFMNASTTYGGNMSGSGSLVSFMPGATLTVTGTNTYTGGTTISNGTFQIGNATAGSSVAGNITNYGTLNLYRSDAFVNQNTITSADNTREYGNGDINVRGAGGMTVDGTAPISTSGNFSVGQSASGKLTVNAGALMNIGGYFHLGNPNNAAYYGDVTQNGGTINVSNQVRIAHWGSEISYYAMKGGTLNVPNQSLNVGWDGIGVMTMDGGAVNCRAFNVDGNTATAAIGGTNSTFTMNGGLLNIGTGGIGGNTATFRLGGGTIAAIGPAGFTASKDMILTNGTGMTFDSSNTVITVSGVLSGTNGFVKQGTGYLDLNGANTFTGAVTVANGTLEGTGTVAGPVTVQSGASLSAGGLLAAGTLTLSNITMNSGAGMTFDLSSTAGSGDLLVAKGTLALDGVGTPATLNFLGGVPYTGGPYTLITNWVPRTGNLVLAPSGLTRYVPTVDQTNPNRIQVSFSGANANLVWKGTPNNQWNVNGDANWLNAGVADKYFQSDAVIFDSTGIGTPHVVLASTMTPASVTVNAAGNYSFSGAALAGLGNLTKSGSGTLTISNNVNLVGTTTVNGGTLQIGNGGTTGFVAGNISDFGSVVFNRSDTVAYGINPVNAAAVAISGPGSLTQAGSGTLMIIGTMNHYGGTIINPGTTVQVGNGATVDVGSLGNSTASNNGTLKYYRLSNVAVATPLAGNGSFIFQGTGNSGQSGYVLNATNTFTGPVTLNYARIQSGAGALSFGSPSSITVQPASQVYAIATPYSSVYNIPLTLAGTGWQDGLGALRIENTGTWAGPITLAANARIGVNNATTNTITGNITGNYELETYGGNAAAALILAPSSANSYNALRVSIGTAGATTIAGNANAIPNNIPLTMNGGTLKLNGFSKSFSLFQNLNANSSIRNGSDSSPASVTLAPPLNAAFTYSGTFADGGSQPLAVTFNQTGPTPTLTLGGTSGSWTGNFTNNGGTITTAAAGRLGVANVASRTLEFNNCTWNLSPNNGWSGGGALATMMFNNSTLNCARYNVFGPIFLNGSTLTGTNTGDSAYYATYNLNGGKVTVRGSAPSVMSCFPVGQASAGFNLQTPTVFDVAEVTGNAAEDLTVSAPLRTGGAIGGAGALIKTGAGKMLVTDMATYTGSTTISNGTLALSGSGNLASSPSITIASGAKLDVSALSPWTIASGQSIAGSGAVIGDVSDTTGTVISPGTSAGTLSFSNNLTLGWGGSLTFDLANVNTVGANVNDLVIVGGTLDISAVATPIPVSFNFPNGAPALGVPYRLFQCGAISGTVSTAFTNSTRYVATFAQSGNNVTVTFAGSATNLVWTGTDPAMPGTWDVATSTNWFDGTGDNLFYDSDTVRFDDTSVNTTVTLASTVRPAAITLDSTNDYTFSGSGKITGLTTITKNNTNTVTLGVANDAVGPINVNAGILKAISTLDDTYDGATIITVKNGAAFNFDCSWDNLQKVPHNFVLEGSGPDGQGALRNTTCSVASYSFISNVTFTADTVIGTDARLDIGPMAGSTINGQGYKLTKVGASSLNLRVQTITNVASITVSNGLLFYENYDQTDSWTATTTNYVKPGASVGSYGGRNIAMPIALDGATILNQGSGAPIWSGPITIQTGSVFNNSLAQNFFGPISGPGAMWVNGGWAALTISNANTYQGGTVISNAPSTTSAVDATAGSAAVIAKDPNAFGTGPITINGSAYPSLTTNTSFFLTNVLRAVEFAFAAPGTVPNDIVLPSAAINNVSLHGRDSGQVVNLAGQISGGFTGMTNWIDFGDATVPGVMRYGNAANSFIGNISVFRGWLAITADGSLGNSANVLRLNSAAGLRIDAPGINVAHPLYLTAQTYLNLLGDNNGDGVPDTANTVTLSGTIGGAQRIRPIGGGTVILAAANTHSGTETWTPDAATVEFANVNSLGGFFSPNYGGTFRYTGTGSQTATATLWIDQGNPGGGTIEVQSPTGALTIPSGGTINRSLWKTGPGALTLAQGIAGGTVTVNGGSLTVNGAISGGTTVVLVNSTGTLTLNGANTFNGGTFVNAGGTLYVNGSLAVGNSVTAASGGTLGGTGTINCPVTIPAGAFLAPGVNAIGKLTVNSTLALAGQTMMEINGTSGTNDSVVGISEVTYGGTLNVSNLGGSPANGAKFTLFSAGNRLGSFATVNLPSIAPMTWNNLLSVDGSIVAVASGPSITPVYVTNSVSGTNLVLTWPTDHTGWKLLVQTNNLNLGVSTNHLDWDVVPGSDTTNQVWLPITSAVKSEFYRLNYTIP